MTITIDISLTDHLRDILVRHVIAIVSHDLAQLSGGNETIAIEIVFFEGFFIALAAQKSLKQREIDGWFAVSISYLGRELDLCLGEFNFKEAHESDKRFGADHAITALIED